MWPCSNKTLFTQAGRGPDLAYRPNSLPTPAVRLFPYGGFLICLCSTLSCELFEEGLSHIHCVHLHIWYGACPTASHQPIDAWLVRHGPQDTGVVQHANQMKGDLSPGDSPSVIILPPVVSTQNNSSCFLTASENYIPIFIQQTATSTGAASDVSWNLPALTT